MEIPKYDIEDFLNTVEPYKFITELTNPFEQEQATEALAYQAKCLDKSINFKALLKSYLNSTGQTLGDHYTEFTEQPLELRIGEKYIANDSGVRLITNAGPQVVCMHPIMPSARLVNIDTGSYGVELSYRHAKQQWQTLAVPCEETASANRIVDLAKYGISVSSDTAKNLCKYLAAAQEINYTLLPERKSVNRFGWVGKTDFIPYSDKYIFEGEDNYKQIRDAVHNHGSAMEWYDAIKELRASDYSVVPRIVLASSLASVLVMPCGALPFIVHLWGRTGGGKTLALKLATSVWANPENGGYIHTFNATALNSFTMLSVDALFQADVCEGNPNYKHEYSAPRPVSGFIVKVISGVDVPYEDVLLIGRIILENKALVRRMFVLHWDTLYIKDERNGRFGQWRIRDFVDFGGILPIY